MSEVVARDVRGAEVIRVDLPIGGMTCASCAVRIGRGLSRLEGVEQADVNFATHKATVLYHPDLVAVDDLKQKVAALGYAVVDDATPVGHPTGPAHEGHAKDEPRPDGPATHEHADHRHEVSIA